MSTYEQQISGLERTANHIEHGRTPLREAPEHYNSASTLYERILENRAVEPERSRQLSDRCETLIERLNDLRRRYDDAQATAKLLPHFLVAQASGLVDYEGNIPKR